MATTSDFVIGIPSYKRANKQITLEYLEEMGFKRDDIYISTQTKEDYELYAKTYGNRANIIYREGNCVADNRNTLLEYFPKGTKLLMLDDDIRAIVHKGDKNYVPFTKEELLSFINDAFSYAQKNGALIWGGYPVNNNYFMKQSIEKRSLCVGCIMGIIIDKYRFDKEYKIKEDLELCLQTISDGYNCIRFNFLSTVAKHRTKGGCYDFWFNETDHDSIATKKILLKYSKIVKKGAKDNSIMMRTK